MPALPHPTPLPCGERAQAELAAEPCTSIPLRRAGESIVDNAAIATRERIDLGHLVGAELEIEDRSILRQPLELAGARDDHDLLLHQESQAHLRGALAMLLADAREHRA